jgi:Flp pilus assembly protein TadD
MPRTSISSVQHAVFTDHSIPRRVTQTPVAAASDATLIPFGGIAAGDREVALAYADVALKDNNRSLGMRAFELLKKTYESSPDDTRIATQLAQLYDRMGRESEACEIYERVVSHNASAFAAKVNLGTCRAKRGDLTGAVELWADVVKRSPGQEGARMNLAVAQLQLGNRAGAAATIEEGLKFNPASKRLRDLSLQSQQQSK